jgi:hypothetical protein
MVTILTFPCSFVEFENAADLKTAVEKLDNREFKGQRVNCVADVGLDGSPIQIRALLISGTRRNQTSLHVVIAALVPLRAADPMEHLLMTTIVDPRRVDIVLGVIVTTTVIGALAGTTTMTVVIDHLHPHDADQLMSMVHLGDATMILTDGTIQLPIRMRTVVPMTAPHVTSPHVKLAHILLARIIDGEATRSGHPFQLVSIFFLLN